MTLQISTLGDIILDGIVTKLKLVQEKNFILIYTPETKNQAYQKHEMPRARYSAAHVKPASGAAGSEYLENDVRSLIDVLAKELAEKNEWYAKFSPETGWQQCGAHEVGAVLDRNRAGNEFYHSDFAVS